MANKNIDKNNDVEMIFGDKVIIAGVDPNLAPPMRKDNAGRSETTSKITGSLGSVEIEKVKPTMEECDNASDRPTGMINLVGMNGVRIDAGSGGIDLCSSGNINFMPGGGMCNIMAPESVSCISKNVSIASTGDTSISGGGLSVESSESSFKNNVSMQGNAKIDGGCFINGEAFIPHMTTQRQENTTGSSGECAGFINPCQTYWLLPGDKSIVEGSLTTVSSYVSLEFDAVSLIRIITDVAKEIIGGGVFNASGPYIPLPVKPPMVHIVSKGIMNQLIAVVPTLKVTITALYPTSASIFDLVDTEADFYVLGHRHKYDGPACKYTNSTAELYEAAKSVEGDDKVKHLPMEPNGGESALDRILEEDKKAVTDYFKNWGKRLAKSAFKGLFG